MGSPIVHTTSMTGEITTVGTTIAVAIVGTTAICHHRRATVGVHHPCGLTAEVAMAGACADSFRAAVALMETLASSCTSCQASEVVVAGREARDTGHSHPLLQSCEPSRLRRDTMNEAV